MGCQDPAKSLPSSLPVARESDDSMCYMKFTLAKFFSDDPGNVGYLVGPPWFDAIADDIGSDNLAAQGVNYTASVNNFLEGGDPEGGPLM